MPAFHEVLFPLDIALKSAGGTLLAVAKAFRIASAIPEYVARFDRRDPAASD